MAGEPDGMLPDAAESGVSRLLPSGSPGNVDRTGFGLATPSRKAVRESLPLPGWIGPLAVVCVVGLIPWIVYLALNLPTHSRTAHYNIAWVGYDIAMGLVLLALGHSALRRLPTTELFAGVASTMLVVDAWFDVATSSTREQFMLALLSAILLEVPLAVLCGWVAVNAERIRSRTYRRLWRRAEDAIQEVERLRNDSRA